MYCRSELNGMAATCGRVVASRSGLKPALAATTSIAPSVGSPTICQRVPSRTSAASLLQAPASSDQRRAALAFTGTGASSVSHRRTSGA
ncbi:Uncharacterised protein [Mycobacterium tuberculosis]|uniref:Uncharacterized protein n=1 Tax=Mycobacterium tuberculosis TaxID=1773 RepID=A0A655DHE9_MYCTX|nr:Uncharacterised protein [Mycobacterium tuberculosis]CFR70793.1 Uncharacterised protein [Mycobacterium tuberculosis]CKO70591.1 Uncharacterised protein [Mycobacterium tuberculosis]CKS97805.1 Uncharacterised protein [Mycobacterium tuberculosis]CNU67435.1 Uncharacterised protein [Mycobacterium tuberculosis]